MLKKRFRLVKRGSFTYVYRNGSKVGTQAMRLAYIKSKGLKIGFSVGTKVGGAVQRNLVKRRMRHAAASLIKDITAGYQMVFLCSPEVAGLTYKQIHDTMRSLLKRALILKD